MDLTKYQNNHDVLLRCHNFVFYCHSDVICNNSGYLENNYPHPDAEAASGKSGAPNARDVKVMQVDRFDPPQMAAALRFMYDQGKFNKPPGVVPAEANNEAFPEYPNRDINFACPLQSGCLITNVAMYMTGVAMGMPSLMEYANKWLLISFQHLYLVLPGRAPAWDRSVLADEILRCWQLLLEQPREFCTHPNVARLRFSVAHISNLVLAQLLRQDPSPGHLREGEWTLRDALAREPWTDSLGLIRTELEFWSSVDPIDPMLYSVPAFTLAAGPREFWPPHGGCHAAPTSEPTEKNATGSRAVDDPISEPHGSVENGFGTRGRQLDPRAMSREAYEGVHRETTMPGPGHGVNPRH